MKAEFIVSACLAGINCRYDGKNNFNSKIVEMVKNGEAIAVCPEELGGLQTPRIPCEIVNNRVLRRDSIDVTEEFTLGAKQTLKIAQENNISRAVMQPRSPSCGLGNIYDGTFTGKLIEGNGITVQLLLDNNIEVTLPESYVK